jgi:hypothetical protein
LNFEFLFFIADRNALQQQHTSHSQLGLKPAAAKWAARHIYIFSISFKVLYKEMFKWKWYTSGPRYLETALASSLNLFIN